MQVAISAVAAVAVMLAHRAERGLAHVGLSWIIWLLAISYSLINGMQFVRGDYVQPHSHSGVCHCCKAHPYLGGQNDDDAADKESTRSSPVLFSDADLSE